MTDKRDPVELLPLTPITYHVLLTMAEGPRHGYGIIKEILRHTEGQLQIEAGTLYAAVKRLRETGLIDVAAQRSTVDSRRRYYRLTPFGRQVLRKESERLSKLLHLAREKKILSEGSAS
jgi:DNA-binding PadR family transcriptional regulator